MLYVIRNISYNCYVTRLILIQTRRSQYELSDGQGPTKKGITARLSFRLLVVSRELSLRTKRASRRESAIPCGERGRWPHGAMVQCAIFPTWREGANARTHVRVRAHASFAGACTVRQVIRVRGHESIRKPWSTDCVFVVMREKERRGREGLKCETKREIENVRVHHSSCLWRIFTKLKY